MDFRWKFMNDKRKDYEMKVLMLNGSPHAKGTTDAALREMEKIFLENGVETEIVQVGNLTVTGCKACGYCYKNGKCVFDDVVNEIAEKMEACDGMVIGSPVYYGAPNGALLSVLNRLFYSTHFDKRMKVGASVVTARRGGLTASFDVLNKYFTISGMPVAAGQYWNGVHGHNAEEAMQDKEGMQMMRSLARNMTFLMKSIALGKEAYGLPEREPGIATNFIR